MPYFESDIIPSLNLKSLVFQVIHIGLIKCGIRDVLSWAPQQLPRSADCLAPSS